MPFPAWNWFFNLERDLDKRCTLNASTWSLLPVTSEFMHTLLAEYP
jgi:hypothetical protein